MFWNSIILVAISPVLIGVTTIKPCKNTQWQCRDGSCIRFYDLCNGVVNCTDGSDETHAACLTTVCSTSFRCTYGGCVAWTSACDGLHQCIDNSDELLPKCSTKSRIHNGQFKCSNEQNILVTKMCDGKPDCADNSDEKIEVCAGFPCDSSYFQCAYGACVNADAQCNGKQDCFDGSDEAEDLCNRTSRFNYAKFSSHYGTLCKIPPKPIHGTYDVLQYAIDVIQITVRCNPGYMVDGMSSRRLSCSIYNDGADWMVDLPKCIPNTTKPVEVATISSPMPIEGTMGRQQCGVSCKIPANPLNGEYVVTEVNCAVVVSTRCDLGYTVDGSSTRNLPCFKDDDENFQSLLPKCLRYCDLPPHPSVTYNCEIQSAIGRVTRRCGVREFVGTTVMPACNTPNYYGSLKYMRCTEYGWDHIATCQPECGRVTLMATPTSLGGKRVNHSDVPWHAGIYDKLATPYRQICGGSIVSTTAVITAAHCFWREFKEPAENYTVAVGKIYRDWNDSRDTDAQYSNITDIIIPESYRDSDTNYQSDIAIVKLETKVVYTTFIRPVCISFDYNFNLRQLKLDNLGKIAGWGLTEKGVTSTALLGVELPFIPFRKCFDETLDAYKQYISNEKFCAGYLNGTTLCEGDSGGGLTFQVTELDIQRSYLLGIASASLRDNDKCNPFVRSTFTNINEHLNFLQRNL